MKYLVILLSLFALTFFTTSCASTEPEPAPVAENTMCVMNPEKAVDPAVNTAFEGHTVAFCCNGCMTKFAALNRGQKVAKLQAVGVPVN